MLDDIIDSLLDMIHFSQLEVLGYKTEHGYFLAIILSILLLSVLIKPIITILTYQRYTFVLMYIIVSLIIIIISLVLTMMHDEILFFKIGIQCAIIFGFTLAFYMLYKTLITQVKIK